MKTQEVIGLLNKIGIIPVVKLDRASDALPLAKALIDGNIPCAEVTFRTDQAAESIRIMSENYPEMLVGSGTCITTEQVDLAIESGAKFIVSPGLNPDVVKHCQLRGIPIVPGVANAGDIERAIALGLDYVKFFPAEINGGLNAIKALAGPFPNLKMIPTGGVTTDNMNNYLNAKEIVAVGGTWMVKDELILNGKFDEIRDISKEAVRKMLGFELVHVSVDKELEQFNKFFSEVAQLNPKSHYANDTRLKENSILVRTHNIQRAEFYLENMGYEFESVEKDSKVRRFTNQLSGKIIQIIED